MPKAELELNFDMWKDDVPTDGASVTIEIAYEPPGDEADGHVSLALNHALKESGQVTRLWYPLNDAERRQSGERGLAARYVVRRPSLAPRPPRPFGTSCWRA